MEEENAFAFESSSPVIYDTGSSIILVADEQADAFFTELTRGQNYVEIWEGVVMTTCDYSTWPEVFFLTGDNYWVSILPEDYVVKSPMTPDDEDICYINIMPSWDNFWLAGNNFLRGYYSVHNVDNHELGLTPHTTSDKSALEAGNVPEQVLKASREWFKLLGNLLMFTFAWAAWFWWIEYQVENVTYWLVDSGSYQAKTSLKKSTPSVKSEDPEELKKLLSELQAKLAVNNSMD